MKKMIFILLLMIISACEESTEPVENITKYYLPLELGRYWIYQNHELNQYGAVINGSQFEDSVVIEESHEINGYKTYYFKRYRNGIVYDTLQFAQRNNRIYQYQFKDLYIPEFAGDYLPIINFDTKLDESWNVFNKINNPFKTTIDGKDYNGIYRHTINGTFASRDSVLIDGKLYLSKLYSNKYDSKLEFKIGRKNYNNDGSYFYDTLNYTKLLKYVEWYRLAEGIGFTQIKREPYTMNVSTSPSSTISEIKTFNGKESVLLRFGKNK